MSKNLGGQIIIEVLIAISIVTIGLVAVVQMSGKSISNSGASKRQTEATAYAQQGMEWIKNQRNQMTWTDFSAKNNATSYCLNSMNPPPTWTTWTAGSCGSGTISGKEYARSVLFTADNSSTTPQLIVKVDVTWQDTSGGGATSRTAHAIEETVFAKY